MFSIPEAIAATIDVSIPCISCKYASSTNPIGVVADFYELAIAFSGILALGMIIYAGILRVTSSNNPKSVGESNDIISSAVLGLVLLFGSYVLLNTVNPQLTQLEIPKPDALKLSAQTSIWETKPCGGEVMGACPIAGQSCLRGGTDGGFRCVGGCGGTSMGTCSVPTETCQKGPDGNYACLRREDLVYRCRGQAYVYADDGQYTLETVTVACTNRPPEGSPGSVTGPAKARCDENCVFMLSTNDRSGRLVDDPDAKCDNVPSATCAAEQQEWAAKQ